MSWKHSLVCIAHDGLSSIWINIAACVFLLAYAGCPIQHQLLFVNVIHLNRSAYSNVFFVYELGLLLSKIHIFCKVCFKYAFVVVAALWQLYGNMVFYTR